MLYAYVDELVIESLFHYKIKPFVHLLLHSRFFHHFCGSGISYLSLTRKLLLLCQYAGPKRLTFQHGSVIGFLYDAES